MLRIESKQSSFYCLLYNKIPENHILKQIKKGVDFRFINELLKDTYCENFGCPAKEPELMYKLLFLQHIYNLSNEKVIVEASFNLTQLFFLDLNPEDTLPERSLLSKVRKLMNLKRTKKRASIEGKNAELKRFHGLGRAKSYSLVSMSKQTKLAAIAVN